MLVADMASMESEGRCQCLDRPEISEDIIHRTNQLVPSPGTSTGLQQGDRVGVGEDEGGGEAVAGDDQHWDWGTPRQDCLHLNCSNTGPSGNRYDVFIALTRIYYQGSRLF